MYDGDVIGTNIFLFNQNLFDAFAYRNDVCGLLIYKTIILNSVWIVLMMLRCMMACVNTFANTCKAGCDEGNKTCIKQMRMKQINSIANHQPP